MWKAKLSGIRQRVLSPTTEPKWLTAETSYVLVRSTGVVTAVIAGALWWTSAWSPAALDRPTQHIASGDIELAISSYAQLADGWGPERVREQAAWRAAQLRAVHGETPREAAVSLLRFIEDWPDSANVAHAWARLAGVYSSQLNDRRRAAEAYQYAAWAAPDDAEAGRWLLEAGRAFASLGDADSAERALGLATQDSKRSTQAWLALARMRLQTEPSQAYDAYDMALRTADAPDAANLARLGRATALERLEGGNAALAVLDADAIDASDDVALTRRRNRLRNTRQ